MTIATAFNEINNAVLDLQQADYNTFERPLRKLAKAVAAPELKEFGEELKAAVDFDAFVEEGSQEGSMAGSATLNWPDDKEREFGLVLTLIERGAADPNWFMGFGHHWFYDGRKTIAGIRKMTKSVIIPFCRDFKTYVTDRAPATIGAGATDKTRIFIVHGHDEGPRETLARFLEKQGFEAVILHERANAGMTIPEKLIKYGSVGFAVVLLTPDDIGRAKTETLDRPRARQNVVLELGYFVGRLGRDKVCALLKGDVELPTDFVGVGYVRWDDAGAWKMKLAQELHEAGYDVDFNKVMKGT